jgi:hypothetical protein
LIKADVHTGLDSSMFLVPSLNIVFSKSLDVRYSSTTCMASGTEVTSWSLDSPSNFKVDTLSNKEIFSHL